MNKYDNLLVSIEGIDQSGGTTLWESLREELNGDWEFSKEPSEGAYGRIMRDVLQSDDDPSLSDFFLFCADRVDHIESLIGPKLEDDDCEGVILDRYNLSTYAYQSPIVEDSIFSQHGIPYITQVVSEWVIQPDITIVLDIPVDESLNRMDSEKGEMYERRENLENARSIYKRFVNDNKHIVEIDATQDKDVVLEEAISAINECRE